MSTLKHKENAMDKTTVKVKKLNPNAKLPTYGTEFSAGADLYACLGQDSVTIGAGETVFIHTGIALEIPSHLVGLVYARSGLACKQGLAPANKVGVVDSDYRGEIMIATHNHSNEARTVKNGDRIAQIVFTPYVSATLVECAELDDTVRGTGGFGSTGK